MKLNTKNNYRNFLLALITTTVLPACNGKKETADQQNYTLKNDIILVPAI